ncbi:hypothetical protein GW17_00018579 [Ensete ventricosum]|nr:hypothetical protein GW17_00018579 [Ensete ventricosum]
MLRVSCTMQKKGKKEKEKNAALTQEAHAGKETRGSLATRHAPRKSQNWSANRPSIEEIRLDQLESPPSEVRWLRTLRRCSVMDAPYSSSSSTPVRASLGRGGGGWGGENDRVEIGLINKGPSTTKLELGGGHLNGPRQRPVTLDVVAP